VDALMVIDIDGNCNWQSDICALDDARKKVAYAIQKELARWRESGGLIIFVVLNNHDAAQIEQNGGGCIACDLPINMRLAGFLEHRHGERFEPVFIKSRTNAFCNRRLTQFLRKKKVSRLFLVGCNTFYCVLDTACGAVGEGFQVSLLESCTHPGFSGSNIKKLQWHRDVVGWCFWRCARVKII